MHPKDARLLEKLDRMKAQRKAAAFSRRFRPKSHEERLSRFRENGLPVRLVFKREVKACR